jgi:hypothetical protein
VSEWVSEWVSDSPRCWSRDECPRGSECCSCSLFSTRVSEWVRQRSESTHTYSLIHTSCKTYTLHTHSLTHLLTHSLTEKLERHGSCVAPAPRAHHNPTAALAQPPRHSLTHSLTHSLVLQLVVAAAWHAHEQCSHAHPRAHSLTHSLGPAAWQWYFSVSQSLKCTQSAVASGECWLSEWGR